MLKATVSYHPVPDHRMASVCNWLLPGWSDGVVEGEREVRGGGGQIDLPLIPWQKVH